MIDLIALLLENFVLTCDMIAKFKSEDPPWRLLEIWKIHHAVFRVLSSLFPIECC